MANTITELTIEAPVEDGAANAAITPADATADDDDDTTNPDANHQVDLDGKFVPYVKIVVREDDDDDTDAVGGATTYVINFVYDQPHKQDDPWLQPELAVRRQYR